MNQSGLDVALFCLSKKIRFETRVQGRSLTKTSGQGLDEVVLAGPNGPLAFVLKLQGSNE